MFNVDGMAGRPGVKRMRKISGFGANPGGLRLWTYAPDLLQARPPLVVVLHGCGQTAEDYAEGAGWLTLADRLGFAVVCPEQARENNPNLCFNWFEPADTVRGGGEAASIRQMIAWAEAAYGVDPTRVFVTGLSAGGAMTAVMLATYPEVFAGGAVVAGLPYRAASSVQEAFGAMFKGRSRPAREWGDEVRAASRHRGPWPSLSIWHGDVDATVKVDAAEQLARQWTDVQGLAGPPAELKSPSGRTYRQWSSPAGRPYVALHRIAGMGHGVPLAAGGPDGCGTPGPFLLEVGVSSSLEIAQSWGLATVRSTVQADPAPEAELLDWVVVPPEPRSPPPDLSPRGLAVDIEGTISKALRAAGLMK